MRRDFMPQLSHGRRLNLERNCHMTTKYVVADDVLGKVYRRMAELTRRILEDSVSPDRSMFYLQTAIEGISNSWVMRATYLIESFPRDHFEEREFATLTLPNFGENDPVLFECILTEHVPRKTKQPLLDMLDKLYEAQFTEQARGGRRRVSRILRSAGAAEMIDRQPRFERVFTYKPLFDLDEQGNPVPCDFTRG
jgi:hypothetical protein